MVDRTSYLCAVDIENEPFCFSYATKALSSFSQKVSVAGGSTDALGVHDII